MNHAVRGWIAATLPAAAVAVLAGCAGGGEDTPALAANTIDASRDYRRIAAHFDPDLERPLIAGFLIVDGVYNSELMAPYDIFHHTRFHTQPRPGIEVFTVSPDGQSILSFEGLTIQPHYGFDDAPPIDILVVPSAEGSMDKDLENEAMMAWVRRVGADADFVVSLCDGAFVLAEAGLLDARRVTTFPSDQDRFAERFPSLDLVRGVSFVHDGAALTSEGGAKSYDVAMYLVDHLYGADVATRVGKGLILRWPPQPGSMPMEIVSRVPNPAAPDGEPPGAFGVFDPAADQ